eukprot:TRINITY_DN2905_c0_g1_i1.p1 TRINITY_DN2905_c0_g1~~TRINITY_DN2905_c0_g1_i1.p1  ORF type:complete len:586 (+),score=83.66 TRINITY_DN2905_c0_g1_i1:56-1813(+)
MGVWSLLQYFENYHPSLLRQVRVEDALEQYDVVLVDANSVLHGSDVTRLVYLVSVLRPAQTCILAADAADAGKNGKPKPGKYLSACRYFLSTTECIKGKRHEQSQSLPDQEDYTSPLLLPQAVPNPVLSEAVNGVSKNCLFSVVARDVPGPADTKIAALSSWCSGSGPDTSRQCIVSRDNDLLLTALSTPRANKRPPHVVTWPSDSWETSGLIVADLNPFLSSISSPIDFTLLVVLTLGNDSCPGVVGGCHFTHLHSLVERFLAPGEEAIVVPCHNTHHLKIDLKLFTSLLSKLSSREGETKGSSNNTTIKQWCLSLWAAMAALVVGRPIQKNETYNKNQPPPSASAIAKWLRDHSDEASSIFNQKYTLPKIILELYSTDKNCDYLYGQGELIKEDRLPPRNVLCEKVLPPLPKTDIFRVRLALTDALTGRLRKRKTSASNSEIIRTVRTYKAAPTLFKGFGKNAKTPAKTPPAPAVDVKQRIWDQMMGSTPAAATNNTSEAQRIMEDHAKEKKNSRLLKKRRAKIKADETGLAAPSTLKRLKKDVKKAEDAAAKQAIRKTKARAVAAKKLKKKRVVVKKKKTSE